MNSHAPITVTTFVVAANELIDAVPAGEYRASGPNPTSANHEEGQKVIDRLYSTIKALVATSEQKHREDNCVENSKELLPDKKNNITYLATNEFFFYTQNPLTKPQFEELLQRIYELAKLQPENMFLLLGSFAVLTDDESKVINVFPHIQCGENPVIHLPTKNNPSKVDPIYNGKKNVTFHDDLSKLDITIRDKETGDKKIPFSFNPVFECEVSGGAKFYSCIDPCLDYQTAVASRNFTKILNDHLSKATDENRDEIINNLPYQLLHFVVSNHIPLKSGIQFAGDAIHIDSIDSHTIYGNNNDAVIQHPNSAIQTTTEFENHTFGDEATIYITKPKLCNTFNLKNSDKLISAVIENNSSKVEDLLSNGTIPDIVDSESGATALNIAIMCADTGICQKLLNKGADSHRLDQDGFTPLYHAIVNKKIDVVNLILASSKTREQIESDIETLDFIYKNLPHDLLTEKNIDNQNLLLIALKLGRVDIIEWLAQKRDLSFVRHSAEKPKKVELDKILPDNHTNTNAANTDGNSALYFALDNGNFTIAQAHLKASNNHEKDLEMLGKLTLDALSNTDDEGRSLAHIAVLAGRDDIIDWIAQHKHLSFLINNPDVKNHNPIYYAVESGNIKIVENLVNNGANINAKESGCTFLQKAVELNNPDLVQLLLINKANPHIPNLNGLTPLYYALESNKTDFIIIVMLLKNSINSTVDLNMLKKLSAETILRLNSQEPTLADIAEYTKRSDIIEWLEQHRSLSTLSNLMDKNNKTQSDNKPTQPIKAAEQAPGPSNNKLNAPQSISTSSYSLYNNQPQATPLNNTPLPLNQQPIFASTYANNHFPVAEKAAKHVLSLPMHPYLSDEEQDSIINHLTEALLTTA